MYVRSMYILYILIVDAYYIYEIWTARDHGVMAMCELLAAVRMLASKALGTARVAVEASRPARYGMAGLVYYVVATLYVVLIHYQKSKL